LLLAYDQGFEHGPTDFNDESVDPANIIKIAREAGVFTGVIFQKGVAEKYYSQQSSVNSHQLPALVVKLNGKTNFHQGEEPYSPQICTVDEAIALGAKAVGYTIYVGSEMEAQMMKEFSAVEQEAHQKGLVVIGWMYPRGKHVTGKETTREVTAYAARIGLEMGCDFVKIHYTGDPESFSWVVRAAGKAGVFAVGGAKVEERELLKMAQGVIGAGAVGMAVGRNIWQDKDPVGLSKRLAEVVFGGWR
jgi:class I fructose-bisphosphate aldolase